MSRFSLHRLLSIALSITTLSLQAQFAHHTISDGSDFVIEMQVVDFNNNGLEDILFLNNQRVLKWMAQTSPGVYGAPDTLATEVQSKSWYAVSLSSDPYMDLVYLLRGGGGIIYARQNIDGTLQPQRFQGLNMVEAILGFGYFNDDVILDVAVQQRVGNTREIGWIANGGRDDSNSRFMAEQEGFFVTSKYADIDADGATDIVYASNVPGRITWTYNWGAGVFSVAQQLPDYPDSLNIRDIYTVDLDGDGDSEVLVQATGNYNRVHIYPFDSLSRHFVQPSRLEENGQLDFTLLMPPVDYDGDDDLDLIVDAAGETVWLANDGNGSFAPGQLLSTASLIRGTLRLSQQNTDTTPDLLRLDNGDLTTYLSQPNGQLTPPRNFYPAIPDIAQAAVADVNADSQPDIVYHIGGNSQALYWLLNEDGNYTLTPNAVETNDVVRKFAVGDLNADTLPDLVYTTTTGINWLPNTGQNNFGLETPVITDWVPALNVLELVDVDGDNDLDIVSFSNDDDSPVIFNNDGNGNFSAPQLFTAVINFPFHFADWDADGDDDLLTAIRARLQGNENDGSATMQSVQVTPDLNRQAFSLEAGDLNGDGLNDLLFSSDSIPQWLPNTDDFTFGAAREIGYNQAGFSYLLTEDFDQDGDVDVFSGMQVDSFQQLPGAVLYDNTGDGSQFEAFDVLATAEHNALFRGDVDADGFTDILYYTNRMLGWYENLFEPTSIAGRCFWDENENGIFDADERVIRNVTLTLTPEAGFTYTNQAGDFRFFVPVGTYTLGFLPNDCWTLTTDSLTYQIALTSAGTGEYLFGFTSDNTEPDWQASLAPSLQRCDQTVPVWGSVTNSGCGLASGQYTLQLPTGVSIASTNPVPDIMSENELSWTFTDLEPGQQAFFQASVQVPGAEAIGQELIYQAIVYETTGEVVDSLAVREEVRCAFDPNDKGVNTEEFPADYEASDYPLLYTIRFQNTGNDTAFRVEIRDTLSEFLDWSTFEPRSASHSYRTYFQPDAGIVSFLFDPIALPDSNVNLQASQGYVQFRIAPRADLMVASNIDNTAAIYFDSNPPIITNTISTVVLMPNSTEMADKDTSRLAAYPNPTTGLTTVSWLGQTSLANTQVIIYDALLRQVEEHTIRAGQHNVDLDIEHLPAGCYTVIVRQTGQYYKPLRLVKQ